MFAHVHVEEGTRFLVTPEEVESTEKALGLRFPTGYADYVTTFGEGILGGDWVRIYPPWRILSGDNKVDEWRERVAEYWFWDDGREILTQEQAAACVIIGDTFDGDELIVHPSQPDRIVVLPRHREDILVAGEGLEAAIEWLCGSGVLTEAFEERTFIPFDSRAA